MINNYTNKRTLKLKMIEDCTSLDFGDKDLGDHMVDGILDEKSDEVLYLL